eukprot:365732-Chlamydomonas_euryale.AAC.7
MWASPYQQLNIMRMLEFWKSRMSLRNRCQPRHVLFVGSSVQDTLDEVSLMNKNYEDYEELHMPTQQCQGVREQHLVMHNGGAPAHASRPDRAKSSGINEDMANEHRQRKRGG